MTFGVFSISVSLWAYSYGLFDLATNPSVALFWNKILMSFAILISVSFLHFVVLQIEEEKKYRTLIYLSYLIGAVFLVLIPTDLFIKDIAPLYGFKYWPVAGIAFHPFFFWFSANTIMSHLLMLEAIIRFEGAKKRQLVYIFIGTFIGFIGGATNYFMWYNIPFPPIGNPLVACYVFTVAYAITKAKLMDISLVVSRSIAYLISVASIILGYLILHLSYTRLVMPQKEYEVLLITIVYIFFAIYYFERIRLKIQTSSDKLFLKGQYDYTQTTAYVSEKLASIVSYGDLFSLMEKIRIDNFESEVLQLFREEEFFKIHIPLVDYLSKNRMIIQRSKMPKDISEDKSLPEKYEYIVPCFTGEKLNAVLFVGKKLSEDPYSQDELNVFRVIAPQIATVIERIRPYEKVKEDYGYVSDNLKRAQEKMEEQSRLASLGVLAAGLAHEIRNPMAIMRARAQTVIDRMDDKEYLEKFARSIPEQIDRILNIVTRMLKFARTEESMDKIEINKVLEETMTLLDGKFKDKEICLIKEFNSEHCIVGNPVQLSESFFNILLNSIDFMDIKGTLKVLTESKDGHVYVSIIDTGKGIPQENLNKIFDPFFTTRPEGNGLGLSIVHKTITTHKGFIEVKSEINNGTEFNIRFPVAV